MKDKIVYDVNVKWKWSLLGLYNRLMFTLETIKSDDKRNSESCTKYFRKAVDVVVKPKGGR